MIKTYIILFTFIALRANPILGQFHINGSAIKTDSICYQLTTAQNWQVGSIWDTSKINLNYSFQALIDVFFGCQSFGADGIVFGFQPVSTSIGAAGEGIGFKGVIPSLGIEMDTYQNLNLADPPYDHIAIIKNGDPDHHHANTLFGPRPFDHGGGTARNIKDCVKHDLKVNWDADSMILEVFFECFSVARYHGDIVNEIFNGDPWVYWGFTSATGGQNNEHNVCLKYTTFLDKLPDTTLCKGGTLQLNAKGGVSYAWTPAAGLDNPNIPNPIAKPDSTTRYIVLIKDNCQRVFRDTQTIKVGGDPIEKLHLGPDTLLCDKNTLRLDANVVNHATFLWSDNSTDSVLTVSKPGTYSVTVKKASCTARDTINIKYLTHPVVQLPDFIDTCLDKKVLLSAKNPAASYIWQDGSTLENFIVLKPGLYTVAVYNACGTAYGQSLINYRNCHRIYVPNVFSPEANGAANKAFYIQDYGDIQLVKTLQIYDRWGALLYQNHDFLPNDPLFGWTGANSPTGVYVYYAEMLFNDGETYFTKGDVTLLR